MFSDFWLEQGGVRTITISNRFGYITISYPKLFRDTNYFVVAMGGYITGVSAMCYNVNSKKTSSVYVQGIGANTASANGTPNPVNWLACGY